MGSPHSTRAQVAQTFQGLLGNFSDSHRMLLRSDSLGDFGAPLISTTRSTRAIG
jgi:hypothetical protein